MKQRVLLYLAPVPYESFWQRPHYSIRELSEEYADCAIWYQPYPTRLPRIGDFFNRTINIVGPVSTGIEIFRTQALPIDPLPFGDWLNSILFWRSSIGALLSRLEGCDVILGVGKPSELALLLIENLNPSFVFYDAMDDFPEFYSGISGTAMRRVENELVNRVDQVLVPSTFLKEKFDQQSVESTLIHNAYDMSTVKQYQTEKSDGTLRIGYIGTIGWWFDWTFVTDLAILMPSAEIHIIGPMYNKYAGRLPSNIKVFPSTPQHDAYKYLSTFDIGLIPFLPNKITACVDPIKYYEYKAYGLPIVSTDFGEMKLRHNEDGVYICDSADQAVKILNNLDTYLVSEDVVTQFRLKNDWGVRYTGSLFN